MSFQNYFFNQNFFILQIILRLPGDQVRYSRLLEEGDFRGRTANYVYFLLFGIINMTLVASYINVHFLGSALTFMMVYVWGRRNEDVKMSFLGVLNFNAPYLPWVMLTFSVLIGNAITMDLIGIAGKNSTRHTCVEFNDALWVCLTRK